MELSETERLMLVRKKEEICKISSELLTGTLNKSEILAKLNEILSLLSTIEGYAKPDRDLTAFSRLALEITIWLESGLAGGDALISVFCIGVNSIKFDFTRKGLIISIPIEIKEAILNKIQLGH